VVPDEKSNPFVFSWGSDNAIMTSMSVKKSKWLEFE